MNPDRDLLFGLLALQVGLIDQGGLVAAFQAWTRDKTRPLADHLVDRKSLDPDQRSVVESLVTLHLKKHDGDPERSLAAIPTGRSTREGLAALADTDLDATLDHVGSGSMPTDGDADPTFTFSVGESSSEGLRFRVLRPHAQGGLGAVFVALDGELRREVALKQILDKHADDPASRQRFLLEAEITGGLEHPGIVPVYGLGAYSNGRPYYAMRFIRGDSLKEAIRLFHKDEALETDPGLRSLELRKLLRRFTDVCNAIEYAHSRGVLHRDIKPGNVIVGKHGETLVVDWGLARARGRDEGVSDTGEATLMPSSASGSAETLPGQVIGTPAYMSPEQARGDLDTLGPRSDVYSLGATLACLLTGSPPYSGSTFEILKKVQAGDLIRPRTVDPRIDPALESVCLKALAFRPEDRYPSCRALAEDVERWAADEPVSAYREPLARRARRWAKRNRTAVTAASVALLASLVGLSAVAAVQRRANVALTDANTKTRTALVATQKAQTETVAALGQSEESRKQAEAVGNFLVASFKKPDPALDGKDVKVADILDQALAGLDKDFAGSKATRGAMLDALGQAYEGLALYEKAEEANLKARAVREAALGPDHRDTLASRNNLASVLIASGRTDEAVTLLESTLKRIEAKLGPEDGDSIAIRNTLANAYQKAGRDSDAIALLEAVLKEPGTPHPSDPPILISVRNTLANAYNSVGRTVEAIPIFELALKQSETKDGASHPTTLSIRGNLAIAYQAMNRFNESIPLLETILEQRESSLTPDHPETLLSRNNLAQAYNRVGRLSEAIPLYKTNLKRIEAKLGPDHSYAIVGGNNLASAYLSVDRPSEAIPIFETTLKRQLAFHGLDHPETLGIQNNLANAYMLANRSAEAISIYEATLKQGETRFSPTHPRMLRCRNNLGQAYLIVGRNDEGLALQESTLKLCVSAFGADDPRTIRSRGDLAFSYSDLRRWPEGEALQRENLSLRRKKEKPDSPVLAGDLSVLGRTLLLQGKGSEAEPFLRECLAIRVKAIPDDYRRFHVASLLGDALLLQGQYPEAEPLLVGGYEGLQARVSKIPTRSREFVTEAGDRLVRLYLAWDRPDKAALWAEKLGRGELPRDVFAR